MTFKIDGAYILDCKVVSGKLEGEGPLKDYFDSIDECQNSSFENSEIDMLHKAIDMLLEKNNLKDGPKHV